MILNAPPQVPIVKNSSGWLHAECTCGKKKRCFFPLDGREWRWFFLVVGVLIWTISAFLLWCAPLHWWSCVGQETDFGFDVFWLTFSLFLEVVLPTKKIVLFAVVTCGGNEYGCPQHVIRRRGVGCPWSELAFGAPVMWLPEKTLSFFDSPIACNLGTTFVFAFVLSKSSLALQCNPYVRSSG